MRLCDLCHEDDVEAMLQKAISVDSKNGNSKKKLVTRQVTNKGKELIVELSWKSIEMDGSRVRLVLINDITEKHYNQTELLKTNKLLKTLIDRSPIGVVTIDENAHVQEVWNKKAEEIFGWSAREAKGNFLPYVQEDERPMVQDFARKIFSKDEHMYLEIERVRKDGSTVYLKEYFTPIRRGANGAMQGMLLIEDITERKRVQDALIGSEVKYRNIVEASNDLIWRVNEQGRFTFVNRASYDILGFEPEELIGSSILNFINPDIEEVLQDLMAKVLDGESFDKVELTMKNHAGNLCYLSTKIQPYVDANGIIIGCSGTSADITHIIKYQNELEASLAEKEVLIKEIHHRVKNNLAIISGLFSLQMLNVTDSDTIQLLNESQSRIQSIATIHEKLYQNELFSSIEIASYLKELIEDIGDTFRRSDRIIDINLHAEEVHLNVNQAIPFGILANELITNSYKYAFPKKKLGKIDLSITKNGDFIEFYIRDNGIGLPENFEIMKSDSLGMTLVLSLTDQLNGDLSYGTEVGAFFKLVFKPEEMKTWDKQKKPNHVDQALSVSVL
jgi:PAS domain S-box-containing protein